MPVTSAQLALGANYQLNTYAKEDPVDQFTTERPLAKWLVEKKKESSFGNGVYNEKIRLSNDSNYQNYTGDMQVSYNRKDTDRLAPFYHYESFDGFALNETELADNGIILTDDRQAVMTDAERIQIVNKLEENFYTLKDGYQEKWDLEVHRDGSASALAVPGLDFLVNTAPNTQTNVAGIDCTVAGNAFWRNNYNIGISVGTAGNLLAQMEITWRQCITYGKLGPPDFILAGSSFIDAYAADVRKQPGTTMMVTQPAKGGATLDGARAGDATPHDTGLYFKGRPIVWDPVFDTLQSLDSASVHWDKRCYFLNSKALVLRPNRGRWMVNRKPPRMYDRMVYYFGLTSDYGMTTKKRNSNAVLSIA
jgi:hypothetical protein